MDYLSILQYKNALEDQIFRAVRRFEKETGASIRRLEVNTMSMDLKTTTCTGVSTEVNHSDLR